MYDTGVNPCNGEDLTDLRREYLNIVTDLDENTISVCLTLELSPYHNMEGAIACVMAAAEVFRKTVDQAIPPRQPYVWRQVAYGETMSQIGLGNQRPERVGHLVGFSRA